VILAGWKFWYEHIRLKPFINAALKTLRRSRKIVSLDGNPALVKRLFSEAESVESQVELDELSHRLLDTLSQLSPRQRAVIIQRYYLEMSEEEMSQTLDIAPGTVKWHLNAALTRLRVLLGSERRSR
jgi:RNA polymerase sigma-70 factor (ECF subfamily)